MFKRWKEMGQKYDRKTVLPFNLVTFLEIVRSICGLYVNYNGTLRYNHHVNMTTLLFQQ